MVSYYALVVLAILVGADAQVDQPCSKQIELEMRCMFTVQAGPEAAILKDRMKRAIQTCAPDYPQECFAQKEAVHDCMTTTIKNADTDPLLQESKTKTQPAVDKCFEDNPPDVKSGIEEIFKPMFGPQHHGKRGHHGKHGHHNATGGGSASKETGKSSNDTSSGGKSGKGGESNSGGKSGGGTSGGKSGGKSGEKHPGMPPQCQKTPEQKKCVHEEMTKLSKDTMLIDVINTLVRQKQKCKQIASWSCCATKNKKTQKCLMEASKPSITAFMQRMQECLKTKGFTVPPSMLKGDQTSVFTTPLPLVNP